MSAVPIGEVERIVPSYELMQFITEASTEGTVLVFLPNSVDQHHAMRSVGAKVYGLAREGDAEVRFILARSNAA